MPWLFKSFFVEVAPPGSNLNNLDSNRLAILANALLPGGLFLARETREPLGALAVPESQAAEYLERRSHVLDRCLRVETSVLALLLVLWVEDEAFVHAPELALS